MRALRISTIRLDFQRAENLIPETVQTYVERLKRGDKVPPVRVRFDGKSYWLEDGLCDGVVKPLSDPSLCFNTCVILRADNTSRLTYQLIAEPEELGNGGSHG